MTVVIAILAFLFWAVLFGSCVHLVLCSPHDPDVRLGGVLLGLLLLTVGAIVIAGPG